MARLFVQVEGPTEEGFVNEVLRSHLVGSHGYHYVAAKLMGNARLRDHRGGVRGWPTVRKEIIARLQEDKGVFVTTFVDYYALPKHPVDGKANEKAWPGRTEAGGLAFSQKAKKVEESMYKDVASLLPDPRDHRRFIPFVAMHEFESLLFSDPVAFANGVGKPTLAKDFAAIVAQFSSPEEINDSPVTAPSKRIEAIFIERNAGKYEKPLHGNLAAITIGLDVMRQRCPHFGKWLNKIEALGA